MCSAERNGNQDNTCGSRWKSYLSSCYPKYWLTCNVEVRSDYACSSTCSFASSERQSYRLVFRLHHCSRRSMRPLNSVDCSTDRPTDFNTLEILKFGAMLLLGASFIPPSPCAKCISLLYGVFNSAPFRNYELYHRKFLCECSVPYYLHWRLMNDK